MHNTRCIFLCSAFLNLYIQIYIHAYLINTKRNTKLNLEGGMHSITCNNCYNEYVGETSKNLPKRFYEHKQYLLENNARSAVGAHRNESDHNFHKKMLL